MSDDERVDEQRGAWSAAGGAIMAFGGGGAIAWLIAASTKGTGLPKWPVIPLVLIGVAGLYILLAPLRRWRPWNATDAELPSDREAVLGVELLDQVVDAVRNRASLPNALPADASGLINLGYDRELAEAIAKYGRLVLLPGRPIQALDAAAAEVLRLLDNQR